MYIKNFQQYFEAKNVGVLYHFTSLLSLYQIIKMDELQSNRGLEGLPHFAEVNKIDDYIDKYYFSFTRNKNFHYPEYSKEIDSVLSCRIDIDGTKMSNKYKIYPVSFYSNRGKVNSGFEGVDESEEIIISNNNILEDITKYIININVCDEQTFYNEMLEVISNGDVEDLFRGLKEEFDIEGDEIDAFIEEPETAGDGISEELCNEIYSHIYKFLKSKFPSLKMFKSEQQKLNY